MSSQDKSADEIERLHVLASLGPSELEARYSEDLTKWLAEFVSEELPGLELPPVNSPKAFADAVLELGRNKRSWSNRLAALVIDLSDSPAGGEEQKALERLDEFVGQCPWRFLRESAGRKLGRN